MANPAATAWLDALSGSMVPNGPERNKYFQFPQPVNAPLTGEPNKAMDFLQGLLNETLLMPQNVTNWWNQGMKTAGMPTMGPKPPVAAAPVSMPSGTAIPAQVPLAPRQPQAKVTRSASDMSIPIAQSPDYWTMVNGAEGTGKNPRSSAEGPGQFIDSTFKDYLKSSGKVLGQNGVPADMAEAKKALGKDATMWYKEMNAKTLGAAGVPVNNTTLYGAHFLGPGDFQKVWNADPTTPVTQLVSADAIQANPEVLAGKTAGQVKEWLAAKTSGNVLPTPPQLGDAPQQAAPGALDFSKTNSFLDAAKPKPLDKESYDSMHLSNVLGGLAQGASKVDVTKPGALAATLAAMGAGGQAGMSEATQARLIGQDRKDTQEQGYNMQRAGVATSQMTAEHQNEVQQNQVAFANAKAKWDTVNANNATKYEGDMKERQARMPKITSDANGFMVQQYNPATQAMEVKYTPTKSIFQNMEKASEMIKAMGAPGPAAEAMMVTYITDTVKDPTIAQAVLEKETVRRTLANGAGASVFGKAYEAAYKEAESKVPAALQKDPVEYQKAVQDIAASNLYNALAKSGKRDWLKAAAANGSITAGILSGQGTQ